MRVRGLEVGVRDRGQTSAVHVSADHVSRSVAERVSNVMKYERAVTEVEAWAQRKRKRELELKIYYSNQNLDDASIGALIDKDQVILDAQTQLDRAAAKAAAYGPGAIIEQLRSMR